MCGIAGYIGRKKIDKKQIDQVKSVLKHRGPDANGVFEKKIKNNNLLLIHTRLSIIDLNKRSDQPFYYDNSILIFNGEIYNYLEIMSELKSLGHKFKTKSDTEVLIHSLREWGLDAVEKFEGMWSFAWLDLVENKTYLSRDRFGEKPLYYFVSNEGFYFGSEINIFPQFLKRKLSVNYDHLIKYLTLGYKSLYKYNSNFFNDIKEVEAGTNLIVNLSGEIKKIKYWNKFKTNKSNNNTLRDNILQTREALINSVRLRTRSDVPLAFCMSGGIDSNALISIAKKELNLDVIGFSILSTDKRYNEKNYIDTSSEYLNIKNINVRFKKTNFLSDLRKIISQNGKPLSTISYYLHWLLVKEMSKRGFKVCLSGVGADELFSGYYDHHLLYLKEIYRNKKKFKKSLNYWKKVQMKNIQNPLLKDPFLYIKNKNFREHIFFNKEKYKDLFLVDYQIKYKEEKYTTQFMRNRMLNELYNETVPPILHDDDLNSMSFSIENRSPFLDRNIYELTKSFPTEQLIQNGMAKFILRESVKDIIPKKISQNNRKIGFNTSLTDHINFKDKKTKDQFLSDSPIFEIINKNKIEQIIKSNKFLEQNTQLVFNFISSKIFLENNNT